MIDGKWFRNQSRTRFPCIIRVPVDINTVSVTVSTFKITWNKAPQVKLQSILDISSTDIQSILYYSTISTPQKSLDYFFFFLFLHTFQFLLSKTNDISKYIFWNQKISFEIWVVWDKLWEIKSWMYIDTSKLFNNYHMHLAITIVEWIETHSYGAKSCRKVRSCWVLPCHQMTGKPSLSTQQ